MRILVVFFIAISAFIAINKDKLGYIADMMGISWGALAGAFLAPFLLGLYWKKVTKTAVWVNFIFSSVLMIANMTVRSSFPAMLQSPINCGAVAMISGFVIVWVVSILTKKPNPDSVDKMFACYDTDVTVKSKKSLGE